MGRCCVIGCKTSFKRKLEGGKHLYRFPRHPSDSKRKYYWARFSRRGAKFVPKASTLICQEHFEDKYIIIRKNRVCLTKDAIPTIYVKRYEDGTLEKTIVPFIDLDSFCQDSEDDPDEEDTEEAQQKVQERMDEIKNKICRFCGIIKEPKVEMTKFEIYKVDVNYFMQMMQICRDYDAYLSDTVCEECFAQVVTLETFRVKSKEAEIMILSELKTLNPNLGIEVKGATIIPTAEDEQIIETIESFPEEYQSEVLDESVKQEMQVEYLEEDYEDFDHHDDNHMSDTGEYEETYGPYKIDYSENQEIRMENVVVEQVPQIKPKKKRIYKKEVIEPTDVYDQSYEVPADGIIRNPERNRLVLQVYNCVYCKKNFGGRKTYRAHICDRKEIKCEDCEKTFKKLRSYKQHKLHEHETVKSLKHYCPMCKTVIMGAMSRFKIHRRSCNKERNQPIECEVCGRKCDTLTGYTVHKLFHDVSKNEKAKVKEKKEKDKQEKEKQEKEEWICEQCGKTFKSISGYQCHILTIHTKTSEVFQCPTCGKVCANKLALKDHKRNTHKVEESPCNVCGKVFRTKVLLRKHMMYHDESKRIFKCQFCPDKPGYFTNVALKRHQRSHNGERPYSCSFCTNNYSTSTQLKYHMNKSHSSVGDTVTIHTVTHIESVQHDQHATNLSIHGV